MLLLRREYRDGPEPPEIVLLHAEVGVRGGPAGPPRRFTRAAVPSETPGRRVAYLPLPELREGDRILVRYRFSTVRGGEERFSPWYEMDVPSDDAIADLYHIPEEGTSNLPPAPGRGHFRLVLPLGEGERASGSFRFGFGAMRKKPSPSLCRAVIDAGYGPAPVIEAPEALSVLKNRPMPYFLYHLSADGKLRADKIACARIPLADPDGIVVSARMVWGDSAWRATNFSLMEAKGWASGPGEAAAEFFAEDRAVFLAAREAALSLLPLPRVFEAFVFGPSGSGVEYCFQTVERRPGGGFEVRWRNRAGGGNWVVTL
ncbi:MAG: hypothetical protein H6Q83_1890 [Deltaproteobacteria bacterium]|nr:hypothetical protein [Deltaproteobacteria bacterium]MBP2689703.1 hypothetical protein [Deltaproteobacteria bacterium]